MSNKLTPTRLSTDSGAFTLVELLSVVAIMAIVMGLLVVSLSQGQSRGVQMAAAQVASGLGLARQTAITRNTDAMFIIARVPGEAEGSFLPAEAFRYWAVVYSNRGQIPPTWTLATDWTELPAGTVFMGLKGEGYDTITWTTSGTLPPLGAEPWSPKIEPSSKGDWQYFNNFTNITVTWGGVDSPAASANLVRVPFIGFRATGRSFALQLAGNANFTPANAAVVLGEGSIVEGEKLLLRSTNNITHVETDARAGRIIVRPRESYR